MNAAIFAHPDDETLACGGLIARNPQDWHVAVLTDGVSSRSGWEYGEMLQRQRGFEAAMRVLGVTSFECLNVADEDACLLDQRLDAMDFLELAKIVGRIVERVKPTAVYTHFRGDLNRDHRLVCEAVHVACRPPQRIAIYECEVPSSTEWGIGEPFRPNVFAGLTFVELERKLLAFNAYADEVRKPPHPRSPDTLRARSTHWGAVCGTGWAEPFMLVREVR